MRRIVVLPLLCLLLVGCAAESTPPPTLTADTAVYEGEGYVLTYPACFQPVSGAAKMVNYTVPGANMAFTLTAEENPYGLREIKEYPDLMGIYSPIIPLDDRSFGVEKYQPGVLSAYYVYAFTEDTVYLLEYNFGGEEDQRELERLFELKVK